MNNRDFEVHFDPAQSPSEKGYVYADFAYVHRIFGFSSEKDTYRFLREMTKEGKLKQLLIDENADNQDIITIQRWVSNKTSHILAINLDDLEALKAEMEKKNRDRSKESDRFQTLSQSDVFLSNKQRFKFPLDQINALYEEREDFRDQLIEKLKKKRNRGK